MHARRISAAPCRNGRGAAVNAHSNLGGSVVSRRLITLAIAVLALVVVPSACAPYSLMDGGSDPQRGALPGEERVVVEFWHTYSDLESHIFENELIPLFESAYPAIDIRSVRQDYTEQLKHNVLAAVADGKQPDVMRMDIIWVPELASRGALVDVSRLEQFAGMQGQFAGDLLQTNYYQGAYYGIPVNANTKTAIYNLNLLRAAGLSEPPKTLEALADAARRLKQNDPALYGMGICCSSAWGTMPYFWTLGGALTDESFSRASGYLDSPQSLAALQMMKAWYDEGIISPAIVGGEPGSWDGVLNDKILMIEESHWFFTLNRQGDNKEKLERLEVHPFPDGVRRGTSIIGGENLVLFKNSPNQSEAWTFMRWMAMEEPQRIMAKSGLLPTLATLTDLELDPLFETYMRQLHRANIRLPVASWTEIDKEWAKMIEKILTGEQTLEDAVRATAPVLDRLLAGS